MVFAPVAVVTETPEKIEVDPTFRAAVNVAADPAGLLTEKLIELSPDLKLEKEVKVAFGSV